MITQSVSKRYQRGGSLIELMISSLIGLVLLGVIGSVFISLQKTAREKNLELHLLQGLNVTLMLMKEDIQRAGYDGQQQNKLSDLPLLMDIKCHLTMYRNLIARKIHSH